MDSTGVVVLSIIAALIIVLGLIPMIVRKLRTRKERQVFGGNYPSTMAAPKRPRSDGVLHFRHKPREKARIRPLSPTDRASFRYRWNEVQSNFVEDPKSALTRAQTLVTNVMQARGYPVAELDQAADISSEHPAVLENYRAVRAIAALQSRGVATPEDLRIAMAHFRLLFQELIEDHHPYSKGA